MIAPPKRLSQPSPEGFGELETAKLVLDDAFEKRRDFRRVHHARDLMDDVPYNPQNIFQLLIAG